MKKYFKKPKKIGRGVRHGYCLSPTLLDIHGEWLMNEGLQGVGD